MTTVASFSFRLLSLLIIAFGVHILVLYFDSGFNVWQLVLPYCFNFIFTAGAFALLYFFKERFKDTLGFIFMGVSLLKFLAFFIWFYPMYKADLVIDIYEFAAFFTPYTVALIFETSILAKLLNNS